MLENNGTKARHLSADLARDNEAIYEQVLTETRAKRLPVQAAA